MYQQKAKQIVVDQINQTMGLYDKLEIDDVYVVWFCKTLQNWKALISTDVFDGYYYEVTYNGDKKEAYCDTYVKEYNVCVKDH